MNDFVTKPVRRGDLVRVLRHVTSLRDDDGSGAVARESTHSMAIVPASEATDEPPCDLEELAREYDADPEAIRSLLAMFLPRAIELVASMQAATQAGDQDALRRDAHSLRGISGTVRAKQLFARLEPADAGEEANMEAITAELARVEEQLERELGLRATAGA